MNFTNYISACLILLGTCTAFQVNAQIGVGFRGGALLSNQTAKQVANGEEDEIDTENITGYIVGIPVEFGLSKFLAFQTELNYMKQGYSIESNRILSRPETKVTYDVLEIPVLAKLGWTSKRLSFAAVFGPSFQYVASGRVELEAFSTDLIEIQASNNKIDFSQDVYQEVTRTNLFGQVGFQLGAPITGGKFIFDARYRFAVSDQDSSDDFEVKGRGASATIGYLATFGKY